MEDMNLPSQPDLGTGGGIDSRRPHTSPHPAGTNLSFSPEPAPTRQQRLLQGRNARFLAKKLSISSLNSKLTSLVHPSDDSPTKDQENIIHKSKSAGTLRKRPNSSHSLNVLGEISNSTRYRSLRKKDDFAILQEDIERPLLDHSPFSSPQPYNPPSSENVSPAAFDHIHDSLSEMRSREISSNELFSPAYPVNGYKHIRTRRHPQPKFRFDAEEYIEHLERELQQVKEDAYCSETRRPIKEQLQLVVADNERLHEELSSLRDQFESEVKRTLEYNAAIEVDLRRKLRDLEDKIEVKDHALEELQYQQQDKRVESNIIETLKITIERLELEKLSMEIENTNITKRNDVLTQLLAMSPTKIQQDDHSSPTREKRTYRPLSLVFPRGPSSPNPRGTSREVSHTNSPEPEILDYFGSHASSPSTDMSIKSGHSKVSSGLGIENVTLQEERPLTLDTNMSSRRWTFHQNMTSMPTSAGSGSLSPAEENKHVNKKRPRRFLRGSTQLKPLLLPALTENGIPSATSNMSSPGNLRTRSPSESSLLASESAMPYCGNSLNLSPSSSFSLTCGPGPACENDDDINIDADETLMPQSPEAQESIVDWLKTDEQREHELTKRRIQDSTSEDINLEMVPKSSKRASTTALEHVSQWQNSFVIDTAIPQPLFSPKHRRMLSRPKSLSADQRQPVVTESTIPCASHQRSQTSVTLDIFTCSPTAGLTQRRPLSSSLISLPLISPNVIKQPIAPQRDNEHIPKSRPLSTQYGPQFNSPLDIFKLKEFRARSVASLGIRTVYGLLATCTSIIRQTRKDPYALTRKLLASAWRANWAIMGKASWWVLGLFMGIEQRPRRRDSCNWDEYDGQAIADRICSSPESDVNSIVTIPEQSQPISSNVIPSNEDPDMIATQPTKRLGKSLYLWGKFSVAIMMTIGGALVKGPAEMLQRLDTKEEKDNFSSAECHHGIRKAEKTWKYRKSWSSEQHRDHRHDNPFQSSSVADEDNSGYRDHREWPMRTYPQSPSLDPTTSWESLGQTLRPYATPKPRVHDILFAEPNSQVHDVEVLSGQPDRCLDFTRGLPTECSTP